MSADLYAALLWLALGALAAAILSLLLGLAKAGHPWGRFCLPASAAALIIACLAGVSHYFLDHAPDRVNPMTPGAFFSEHRATAVIAVCALLVMLAGRARKKS